jgi:hypothetical protein
MGLIDDLMVALSARKKPGQRGDEDPEGLGASGVPMSPDYLDVTNRLGPAPDGTHPPTPDTRPGYDSRTFNGIGTGDPSFYVPPPGKTTKYGPADFEGTKVTGRTPIPDDQFKRFGFIDPKATTIQKFGDMAGGHDMARPTTQSVGDIMALADKRREPPSGMGPGGIPLQNARSSPPEALAAGSLGSTGPGGIPLSSKYLDSGELKPGKHSISADVKPAPKKNKVPADKGTPQPGDDDYTDAHQAKVAKVAKEDPGGAYAEFDKPKDPNATMWGLLNEPTKTEELDAMTGGSDIPDSRGDGPEAVVNEHPGNFGGRPDEKPYDTYEALLKSLTGKLGSDESTKLGGVDWGPLLALVDSQTGSSLMKGYQHPKPPPSQQDMDELKLRLAERLVENQEKRDYHRLSVGAKERGQDKVYDASRAKTGTIIPGQELKNKGRIDAIGAGKQPVPPAPDGYVPPEGFVRDPQTGVLKAKPNQKAQATQWGKFYTEMDPTKASSRNDIGRNQAIATAASKIEALHEQSRAQGKGGLNSIQITELALGTAAMLSGQNAPAASVVAELVPTNVERTKAGLESWLKSQPMGANQKKFEAQMFQLADRERHNAEENIKKGQGHVLLKNHELRDQDPKAFQDLIDSYYGTGYKFDNDIYRYTPQPYKSKMLGGVKAAPQQPAAPQPKYEYSPSRKQTRITYPNGSVELKDGNISQP